MIQYIAVIDFVHLDNALFLKSLAGSIKKLCGRGIRGIVIHGDSEYTNRLLQTGVMREEAEIRAARDLNKRLVGFFADFGIPATGLHPYQKEMISESHSGLVFQSKIMSTLPNIPAIILSNLILSRDFSPKVCSLPVLSGLLGKSFPKAGLLLFSTDSKEELLRTSSRPKKINISDLSADFKERYLPKDFSEMPRNAYLTTATDFGNWPELKAETALIL